MTRSVFYFSDPANELSQVQPSGILRLGAEEGRHAMTVRQIREGEGLDLVDGHETRALCEVISAGKQGLDCRLLPLKYEGAPRVRLALVQALAKGERDGRAIKVCTTIGIDGVIPWQSDHTIMCQAGTEAKKGWIRQENTMHTATKQTRHARIPLVEDVADSRGFLQDIETLICQGGRASIYRGEAVETLSVHLRTYPFAECEPDGEVWIVAGPRGRTCSEETPALEQAGTEPIGLGRNVLRSSTADAVCLTLLSTALNHLQARVLRFRDPCPGAQMEPALRYRGATRKPRCSTSPNTGGPSNGDQEEHTKVRTKSL